jgi:2'-5' RNA ligase
VGYFLHLPGEFPPARPQYHHEHERLQDEPVAFDHINSSSGAFAMHRLFVAIRPAQSLRDVLLDLMQDVPGARWQDDDLLHLTLRFIGEVDRHRADDIAAALASVSAPRFAIALAGVGRFERRGRTDALWAGIAPHAALAALHRKVDHALVRAGLPPEGRAYLPHVTVARFSRGASETGVQGFLAAHAALSTPAVPVTHFGLYESRLGREGADYTLVERYALAAVV